MNDVVYIKMAINLAHLSKCQKLKVGCILVKDGRVLSTGVNGTPSGYINCQDMNIEDHHEWSKLYEIHAELNAIIWAARVGIAINGSTAYVTHSPCDQCTKNLIAAGISRIVYHKLYKRNEQEVLSQFCKDNNISIEQIHIDNS